MWGKGYRILSIFTISCILAILVLPGISSGAIKIGTKTYTTLEDAIAAANPSQTLLLISDTPVTLTPGNITAIGKTLTIQQNNTVPYKILLNGTIAFNGTIKSYTLNPGVNLTLATSYALIFSSRSYWTRDIPE